ncbi:MAG: EVE domain-containing protein [Planctomycetota bacterium]|nr:MAG: EVE domain-containing protein [Planctomycetota bacterium]
MRYWLMKSEPDVFSLDDLQREGPSWWDGVRNYQARNFMRDDMRVGDAVLFYHSNAKPPGVAGLARVSAEATPDSTSWDRESDYFDPKSTPEAPRWWHVQVSYVAHFPRLVSLPELRDIDLLADMPLLNRSRLSIQPLEKQHYELICEIAQRPSA